MPQTQSIVVTAAVCGVVFLAYGLYRLWTARAAAKRAPSLEGRLHLRVHGKRDRRRQVAFAVVYLLIGAYLLLGARPRLVVARAPRGAPPVDGPAAEVARIVEAEGRRIGVVVGLVHDGKREVSGYGTLGLADARPPGGDTVFPIGSITKAFTGILLADMAARGEVALTDPVRLYLPPGSAPQSRDGHEITLLDLATHTSGLPRMPPYMGPTPRKILTWRLLRDRYRGHSPDELFERLGEIPLGSRPGTSFTYSNLGMGLLGHALERAAGSSYEELVRRRIAEPLGMTSTRTELTPNLATRLAPGFYDAWRFGPLGVELPVPRSEHPVLQGSGALLSSAEDLLRFLAANLDPPPTPLGDAVRESHVRRRDRGVEGGVGLGWHLAPFEDGKDELIWHSGATGGYTSFLGFLPSRGVGIVVLNNTPTPVDDLAMAILGQLTPPPTSAAPS